MQALFFAALMAVTAGWENICPTRQEFPASEKIWQADFTCPQNFKWELREGARGTVEFLPDGVRIRKTNDAGYILVAAQAFPVVKGRGVRFSADHIVPDADVDYSSGVLRYYGRTEKRLSLDRIERKNFWNGGLHTMRGLPCTAPGMTYRKYGQCMCVDDVLTPVIVVSGAPSESIWKNWFAEDLETAQDEWVGFRESLPSRERRGDRIPEPEFDQLLAADKDHEAAVRRVDGVSRLWVDGEIAAPVVYKARHEEMDVARDRGESFSGRPLDGSAVKLMVKSVYPEHHCDPDGGNVQIPLLVRQIKSAMRAAPRSLFVVGVSGKAPPEFVQRYHPGEAWINEKGEPVMGLGGSCIIGYLGSTKEQFAAHAKQWPSPSSRVWRDWVNTNIHDLVTELKAQGLAKRIVGIHVFGYHDGQYSLPYTDHSRPAQEEYHRMIAEPGCVSTNYAFCMKQAAFRAQEEFVRTFKRAMGKPTIGVMWCESPLQGARNASLNITSFVNSDAMDVVVCQPNYRERLPAFPTVSALPLDSLHLHGKMFWNEYDYRTYAPVPTGDSPVSLKSLGTSADFPMWQSVYRKVAGEADATRMGYWFYDMSGGWFYPPEISTDIRRLALEEEILSRLPPSPWRPDVAIVVDEEQILQEGENPLLRITRADEYIYASSCRLFGTSGVPYERYLAEDALRHPEILSGCKMVVLAFFRAIDARRAQLLDRLAKQGTTLVFLSETGIRGGADATRFRPIFKPGNFGHCIVPEPGVTERVTSLQDTYYMREANTPLASGARCTVEEMPGVQVLARYADDRLPALAVRADADCRRVYVCEAGGLTPALMNRFAREAGAYVSVERTGLQVNMNGDFLSVHCLRPGSYDFLLPFDCTVVNLKTYRQEPVAARKLKLVMTAGETCRFWLGDAEHAKMWTLLSPELMRLGIARPLSATERSAPADDPSQSLNGEFSWTPSQGKPVTSTMARSESFRVPRTKKVSMYDGGTIYARAFFEESSTPPGKEPTYDGFCMKEDEFLLGRTKDGLYFNLFLDGKWSVQCARPQIPIGKWVDLAVTVTKGEKDYALRYYVDGALVQTSHTPQGTPTAPEHRRNLLVGTCWGTQWLFGGRLAALRLFDRPLSADEIKNLK